MAQARLWAHWPPHLQFPPSWTSSNAKLAACTDRVPAFNVSRPKSLPRLDIPSSFSLSLAPSLLVQSTALPRVHRLVFRPQPAKTHLHRTSAAEFRGPPLSALFNTLVVSCIVLQARTATVPVLYSADSPQNVWRSLVVPVGGVDKCRQPLPPGFLHYHVQRFGMVSAAPGFSLCLSLLCRRPVSGSGAF